MFKEYRSWIISVIFGLLISVPAYQVSAQSNILINEVEINPSHDNPYGPSVQWVELYNPSASPVNLGGWVITSNSTNFTITIEKDIILIPKTYLIIGAGSRAFDSQWFSNSNETIVLVDSRGTIIDSIGPFTDDVNVSYTWQRLAVDNDNWVFDTPNPTGKRLVYYGKSSKLLPDHSPVEIHAELSNNDTLLISINNTKQIFGLHHFFIGTNDAIIEEATLPEGWKEITTYDYPYDDDNIFTTKSSFVTDINPIIPNESKEFQFKISLLSPRIMFEYAAFNEAGDYNYGIYHVKTAFIKDSNPQRPSDLNNVTIGMRRSSCLFGCFSYTLNIEGDGTVLFEGKTFVTTKEIQVYQIPQDKVEELVNEFFRIDYFSLKNEHRSYRVMDLPSEITWITINSVSKYVNNNGWNAPEELYELQRKIDEVANSKQWMEQSATKATLAGQNDVNNLGMPAFLIIGMIIVAIVISIIIATKTKLLKLPKKNI